MHSQKQKLLRAFPFLFVCGFLLIPEISYAGPLEPGLHNWAPGIKEFFHSFSNGSTSEMMQSFFFQSFMPIVRYLFEFLALITWTIYIMGIITAESEEAISTQRKNVTWGILGFVLVALATEIGDVLNIIGQGENIIDPEPAKNLLQRIVSGMQVFVVPIALIMIFYAGLTFIRANGQDDEVDKAKKIFQWGFFGMIAVMLAGPLVNFVFYPESRTLGETEIQNFAEQFTGLLNFFLAFLGSLTTFALVVAGAYYVTSFGDDERQGKAKQIIIGSGLGIIIIISSFALVSALVPSSS